MMPFQLKLLNLTEGQVYQSIFVSAALAKVDKIMLQGQCFLCHIHVLGFTNMYDCAPHKKFPSLS